MPYQENTLFQQRRSEPNIKFSSSYPGGINTSSGSLVACTRHLAYPAEFRQFKTCKAKAATGSKKEDQSDIFDYSLEIGGKDGDEYSPGYDVDRKTQLAETELDTRMESLCLSVTEHALGADIKVAGLSFKWSVVCRGQNVIYITVIVLCSNYKSSVS
jgi:hypothetical protein